MDMALVAASVEQVRQAVENIKWNISLTDKQDKIAKAIRTVEALKANLKTL